MVLPVESDGAIIGGNQAAIGDGDAVGIAQQIAQDGLGSREWVFAVEHPLGVASGLGSA